MAAAGSLRDKLLAVPSRFAVLTIEGDDDVPKKSKKKPEAKKSTTDNQKPDPNLKKKQKKAEPGKVSSSTSNQKLNQGQKSTQNQKLNQNQKPKPAKSEGSIVSKKKKKNEVSQEQWDQWQKKDAEFVDGALEQDMQEALLLSQLDYEEKKDVYDKFQKEAEQEKKRSKPINTSNNRKGRKSNKAQPMSLEEFNNRLADQQMAEINGDLGEDSANNKHILEEDPEFFDRIKDDAKKAVRREHKAPSPQKKVREPFREETITIAQFENIIETKDKEITALKEELSNTKTELHNVKTRNKKLYSILAQGEMRDKAEVLVEVDRLQTMHDELTAEVSSLHALLEQERSKVRALSSEPKSKAQSKKRTASETQ